MSTEKKNFYNMLKGFVEKYSAQFEDMPPIEGASKEYTTKDGSKIMIDKMEIGGMCTLPDGTPCPAGEHYLADGSTIYVDEMGKITNIETVAVETTEPAIEDMKKQCMELNAKVGEMLAQFNQVLNADKQNFSEQENKIAKMESTIESQGQIIKEMFEVLSNFSVEKPIEKVTHNFKAEKQSKIDELIAQRLKK